jgi:hypothetical protein
VRAVATLDGRVAGTWTAPGGRVALERFDPAADPVAFAAEVDDVERYLSG